MFLAKVSRPLKSGIIFSLIHFVFTALGLFLFIFGSESGSEGGFPFVVFSWFLSYLDLPISFLLGSLLSFCGISLSSAAGSRTELFFINFVFFSIIGSLQYFFWGMAIGYYRQKRERKK